MQLRLGDILRFEKSGGGWTGIARVSCCEGTTYILEEVGDDYWFEFDPETLTLTVGGTDTVIEYESVHKLPA
jgi:hypothetical protein